MAIHIFEDICGNLWFQKTFGLCENMKNFVFLAYYCIHLEIFSIPIHGYSEFPLLVKFMAVRGYLWVFVPRISGKPCLDTSGA